MYRCLKFAVENKTSQQQSRKRSRNGVVGKPAELKGVLPTKRELRCRQCSEAGGAGGGGAHFRGVDAEAKMREVGLAEGHEASVEVAPDEEE